MLKLDPFNKSRVESPICEHDHLNRDASRGWVMLISTLTFSTGWRVL